MTNQPQTGGAIQHALIQDKTALIRELNDKFRTTLIGGRLILTEGITSQTPVKQNEVLQFLRNYNKFNEDNDPYHEHDIGFFTFRGKDYIFKIDYYAKGSNLTWGSSDPSDPAKTERVLTLMLSNEY